MRSTVVLEDLSCSLSRAFLALEQQLQLLRSKETVPAAKNTGVRNVFQKRIDNHEALVKLTEF